MTGVRVTEQLAPARSPARRTRFLCDEHLRCDADFPGLRGYRASRGRRVADPRRAEFGDAPAALSGAGSEPSEILVPGAKQVVAAHLRPACLPVGSASLRA